MFGLARVTQDGIGRDPIGMREDADLENGDELWYPNSIRGILTIAPVKRIRTVTVDSIRIVHSGCHPLQRQPLMKNLFRQRPLQDT